MMVTDRREFQSFIKPVGARCNLSCSYCYYNVTDKTPDKASLKTMDEKILEKYIIQHFEASPGPVVFFSWHGGEPLLAGLDFYRKAVELQKNHKPDGIRVLNGIQTNGTLLDREWCSFLAKENFYIGISIDGTGDLHDKFRRSKNGAPSFQKAANRYLMLRESGIVPEILCVVNVHNVRYPEDIYSFFKSLGAAFITFIPLVVRGSDGTQDHISVPPLQFGEFLCKIFDEWAANDIGRIKIQIIEEALRTAFDQEHTLCIFKKRCGGVPAIELNGDFYSCDHFADGEHLIGNINELSLAEMLDNKQQIAFGAFKEESLPQYCFACEVREMCNGECPKNRFTIAPSGEKGLNYLCQGYRMFFNHIGPFAGSVRSEWLKRNGAVR
ncbi:MAG: anaerobic sulfatase maturase [Bacteroidales bacterium]|jgi:uncharacterized protein